MTHIPMATATAALRCPEAPLYTPGPYTPITTAPPVSPHPRGCLPLAAQLTVHYTDADIDARTPRAMRVVDTVFDFVPGAIVPPPQTQTQPCMEDTAVRPVPQRRATLPALSLHSPLHSAAARRDYARLSQCVPPTLPAAFSEAPPQPLARRVSEPAMPGSGFGCGPGPGPGLATYAGVDLRDGCACARHHHRRDSVAIRFARTRYSRV
ncbi:hypothetical protein DAKH74_007430 [Maudiozyma humilis]|uniref:Uncharacterized protein n=1 Tax=Maudiozyma humilis TaxID=51915 RepID=A0AAV5RTV0_MAUHU|nr:hypothetical protein DAKH74_007430 [Kazachstania humilis]